MTRAITPDDIVELWESVLEQRLKREMRNPDAYDWGPFPYVGSTDSALDSLKAARAAKACAEQSRTFGPTNKKVRSFGAPSQPYDPPNTKDL